MKLLIHRIWLVFDHAEQPDEIDVFGGVCTVFALPINLIAWLTNMNALNAVLSLLISVLSVAWLSMRVYREWGPTKEHYRQQKQDNDHVSET